MMIWMDGWFEWFFVGGIVVDRYRIIMPQVLVGRAAVGWVEYVNSFLLRCSESFWPQKASPDSSLPSPPLIITLNQSPIISGTRSMASCTTACTNPGSSLGNTCNESHAPFHRVRRQIQGLCRLLFIFYARKATWTIVSSECCSVRRDCGGWSDVKV